MKRVNLGVATAVCVAVGLTSFAAYAGPGEPAEHSHMGMAPLLSVLEPEQRKQVHAIVMGDRARLDLLDARLREARQALITKLLSPEKTVNVTNEVAKLKQAQEELLDERIKLALQARKVMSTEQLGKASALWTKWQSLRAQERALFEEARSAGKTKDVTRAGAPAQNESNH